MAVLDSNVHGLLVKLPNLSVNYKIQAVFNNIGWRRVRAVGILRLELGAPAKMSLNAITVEKVLCHWVQVVFCKPAELIVILDEVESANVLEGVCIRKQLAKVNLLKHRLYNRIWHVAQNPEVIFFVRVHFLVDKQLNVLLLR